MIVILFIVFFVLWALSLLPAAAPYNASGWLAWICVGLLAVSLFHGHL